MNHKRKKARIHVRSRPKSMKSWPAWWDIMYHTRPRRRRDGQIVRRVLRDHIDADAAVYDLGNSRPHNYYW